MSSGPEEGGGTFLAPIYPDLAGKVTEGSGGIGTATCRLLAANGVTLDVAGGRVMV